LLLYLDTSALVKLYVSEPGRDLVIEAVEAAGAVATSTIAYPETLSAIRRAHAEARIDADERTAVTQAFTQSWDAYLRVDAGDDVARVAGHYAQQYGLKGADAIHLASGFFMRCLHDPFRFLTFDRRLNAAAVAEFYPEAVGAPRLLAN
jgi:predicted nucleic acid-binding protein